MIIDKLFVKNQEKPKELRIVSEYLSSIVNMAFDFIEQNLDKGMPEIFDSEIHYKLFLINQGKSKHQYLKKITERVSKLLQNILSKQILLKDINANFKNKRKYLEEILKFIDPNLDFKRSEDDLLRISNNFSRLLD